MELNHEINHIGGNVNAWTTQEQVAITTKVVDEHLARAIDLVYDMFCNSVFPPEEIKRERNVILEEVKMYNDAPDELVIDVFLDTLYSGDPLGQPILGTPENIRRFTREDIQQFTNREFSPDRIVIAVAGSLDLRRIEPKLKRLFENLPVPTQPYTPIKPPRPTYESRNMKRRLEQAHFCMGTTGPSRTDDDRFAFAILNIVLGGGASSRIFHEVREKRGLAYSIGTFDLMFKDSGCFAISGGTSPKTAAEVVEISLEQVRKVYTDGITSQELDMAREQLKSGILLGMESSNSRMNRMAESEIYHGHYVPVNDVLERIRNVTLSDVHAVAEKYLKNKPVSFAGIARDNKFDSYLNQIAF